MGSGLSKTVEGLKDMSLVADEDDGFAAMIEIDKSITQPVTKTTKVSMDKAGSKPKSQQSETPAVQLSPGKKAFVEDGVAGRKLRLKDSDGAGDTPKQSLCLLT
jgi:hypothetical protein